jgi:hypothetical protein
VILCAKEAIHVCPDLAIWPLTDAVGGDAAMSTTLVFFRLVCVQHAVRKREMTCKWC